ncbi:MAG: NUDIX hydrolase, partial [Atopobium minutum]|nr:NUDIX hydrolase [Atopobium minutum]
DTVEYDYPDFHLSMDVFICQLAAHQTPQARVHSELRWLSRDELLDVAWLEADTTLVRSLGVLWEQLFWAEHL